MPQGSFRANAYTTGNQFVGRVAMSSDGSFLVVWQSNDQNGPAGVFARKYDPAGVAGPEFQVNQYTTSGAAVPSVSASADGRFVVAWESAHDGSLYGVFARALDATGAPEGDMRVAALARFVIEAGSLVNGREDPQRALDEVFDLLEHGWEADSS